MTEKDKEKQLWEVARDKLFEKNEEISKLKDKIAKLTGENEALKVMLDTMQRREKEDAEIH